jgi:TldD protein
VPVAWSDLGLETRLPLLERADQAARARDASVAKVSAWFEDETSRILIANSEGLLVEDDQPMAVLAVSVVAQKNGRTETGGWSRSVRDSLGAFTPAFVEGVATRAVDTTVVLFEAGPAPVGELPVVLGPGTPGILLHEAMGHGMEADFNRKGASIFSDRIGQRVAPAGVTIVDDGTNVRLRGSIAIDDEGTPTERTVLVDDGILRSYLHDRLSAAHYRLPSTGNGRRQSFRFPPLPRMRNTYLLNGTRDPNEIIASVERGLYAEDFSNGQVHIGGGDFTFFLKRGRMIEKGRLTHVVKDVNLIGNGPKVLTTLDLVGNDLELVSSGGYCGKDGQRVPVGFGLPTVRAGNISIGGRSA